MRKTEKFQQLETEVLDILKRQPKDKEICVHDVLLVYFDNHKLSRDDMTYQEFFKYYTRIGRVLNNLDDEDITESRREVDPKGGYKHRKKRLYKLK